MIAELEGLITNSVADFDQVYQAQIQEFSTVTLRDHL